MHWASFLYIILSDIAGAHKISPIIKRIALPEQKPPPGDPKPDPEIEKAMIKGEHPDLPCDIDNEPVDGTIIRPYQLCCYYSSLMAEQVCLACTFPPTSTTSTVPQMKIPPQG